MLRRRRWPLLLGVAACALALLLFDWGAVARAALGFDLGAFLLLAVPASLVFLLGQSLRWVAAAGLSFAPRAFWRAHAETALAVATASLTPFQAGEALKLKLARDATGAPWARLGAAFALERFTDLAALLAMAALGFGLTGSRAALALLVLLAGAAAAPFALRCLAALPLPARAAAALAPLRGFRLSRWRLLGFVGGTALKWAAVVAMWQAVFTSLGIAIGPLECAGVMAVVALAVTASLVPGGLGVAELTARALLILLGVAPGQAEAGAVLLRLLTPLLVALGLAHALALRPRGG